MALQPCRLFCTFEDTSTEYKIQKIKYDESEFEKLVSIWSDDLDEKLTCVCFIGDRISLAIGCQHFLELTTEQTDNLANLIRDQVSLVSECLLAYRKLQKIAFIYCSNNLIFHEKSLHPNVVSIAVLFSLPRLDFTYLSSRSIMFDTCLICVKRSLFTHRWTFDGRRILPILFKTLLIHSFNFKNETFDRMKRLVSYN